MGAESKSSQLLPPSSVPQSTAKASIYSEEFIESSSSMWRKYDSEIEMKNDSVVEMVDNLNGYFDLLKQWSEKDADGKKTD